MVDETPPDPDEERYVDDLIARGEAAEADADGNLPDGATHELIVDGSGRRRVVRRRFFGLPTGERDGDLPT